MSNPSTILATILILSDNQDFAELLARLAAREFSAICKIVNPKADLRGEIGDLLISDHAVAGNFPFPVIVVNLPIRLRDLFKEISATLARPEKSDFLPIGENLQLSPQYKTLEQISGDLSIDLTDKEIQLLQAIAGTGEGGAPREDLLKNIWGMEAGLDTHTLETHIYRLRKKIRDVFEVDMIKAVDGFYRL